MDASDRIIVARTKLCKKEPFWGYLAMHLKPIEDKDKKLPFKSMGVDKDGNLYYSSEFVDGLTDSQLLGAILHELCHVSFGHINRKSGYNKMVYNLAADIVTNDILISNDFDLPEGGLEPLNHKIEFTAAGGKKIVIEDIDNKTMEGIYAELYKQMPKIDWSGGGLGKKNGNENEDKEGKGKGKGSGDKKKDKKGKGSGKKKRKYGFDSHFEEGGGKDRNGKNKGKDWNQILSDAAAIAQDRGDLPAGVGRYIEARLYSTMDWKTLLQKYITREIPTDSTWSRPNKKSIAVGGYLPDVVKEKVDVIVAFDVSGSIDDELASEFLGECIGIAKSFEAVKMTILVHDVEVQQVIPVNNGNLDKIKKLEMKGGGGTSHKYVYDWIKKNKPDSKVLINFTDGYTEFPDEPDTLKSLWVLSPHGCNESEIPFGQAVRMEE